MLNETPFTPALCQMGRSALDWPQAELSAASGSPVGWYSGSLTAL
jgi:hypothetical protein